MHPTERRRGVLCTIAVIALCVPAGYVEAQDPPGVVRSDSLVEFDFQDADIPTVLAALAEVAGLNVVYGPLPSRKITLRTSRPIRPDEARTYLENVVRANGLTLVEENGLIRIAAETPRPEAPPPQRPGARAAAAEQNQLRLFVYRLRHTQADAVATTIASLFGTGHPALATDVEPESLSDQLRRQRIPPRQLDETGGITPPAGRPDVEPGLAVGLLGPVQIVADLLTNSLLIRSTATDYETIRSAIQELDVRPLQVVIEVLIAEVRRNRQLALGVSARVPDQRVGKGDTKLGGELRGASTGDLLLRILDMGRVNADVLITALAASGDVTILSRPVVLAQNNQEARILVGSERPFVQLFRSLPTDGAVRDQVVQYRDVGTKLTIRPTINPDGYVSLQVLQEVSTATSETQFGAPVISTREARTQLLVRDGQTVVLGGLIDQQRDNTSSGVPFLKDIPLLGLLFRSSSRRRDVTELFLFLTPHVLRNDEDMDEATRELKQGTDFLRRQIEELVPLLTPPVIPGDSLPPDSSRPQAPPPGDVMRPPADSARRPTPP